MGPRGSRRRGRGKGRIVAGSRRPGEARRPGPVAAPDRVSDIRQVRALLALVLILALPQATTCRADPRWWWHDLRLTATPTDSIEPHLITPGYSTGGAGGQALFITWAERDETGDDHEIYLTASFDGGCTFCEATRLTDDDSDDRNPRVAVLALPTGVWSVQVIFESRGTGEAVIAWDSTRLSFRVPFDQLCAQLTALGPQVVAADQYVRFGGIDAGASWPDISAVGTQLWGHFHATWAEDTIAGPAIRYAHDLTARGGPGWRVDPVKTLAPQSPLDWWAGVPRIAADLATDPDPLTGNTTMDRSAVNIVHVRHREMGPTDRVELVALRSTDSGATFSASGARADGPAQPVGDATLLVGRTIQRPALDAAFSTFSTSEPAWVATAWDPPTPDGAAHDVLADARFLETPAGPSPDWLSPGDAILAPALPPSPLAEPSVALVNQFGDAPRPAWFAWTADRAGTPDIASRAGHLDALASPWLDLSRYPIPPVRPFDSAASADVLLTHCAFDDATRTFPSSRAAGQASQVALDANEFGTFAVWTDTRDGNPEVYFKRTDTFVSARQPGLAAGCGPLGDAFIDVTFDSLPSCPQPMAGERMARYFIFWRTDPAAGYDNAASPVIVPHDSATPTVTRRITGLLPGTAYRVIVVPEDEARNVAPPAFDPAVAPSPAPFNEVSATTPSPCVAAEICLWRSDVTSLSPHAPARGAVYLVPPSAEDIHLQGAAYQCPLADGDRERDAGALTNRVPLVLYQINRPVSTLRLAKDGATIRFRF